MKSNVATRALRRLFLTAVAPVGRRRIESFKHLNLPHDLSPALRYLIDRRVDKVTAAVQSRVELLRMQLMSGATGARDFPPFRQTTDQVTQPVSFDIAFVANVSSVIEYWGTFLYLCARVISAHHILELGSAAGISGCYLASAPDCTSFLGIEGSPPRALLAEHNLRTLHSNATLLVDNFDHALDHLPRGRPFDLIYLDGEHTLRATLHFFARSCELAHAKTLLILDDVRWSQEMRTAWHTICANDGWTTIDVGRMGLCVRSTDRIRRHLSFASFADRW